MFNIVDRYIARNVIVMVIYCTIGLVLLACLIKFVDQIRSIGKGDFDSFACFQYIMYQVPSQIFMFFPLGVLLGTVLALGNLASSSELIVMQSLGKSKLSIVFSACKGVIPLIVGVMLMGEHVIPQAELFAENLRSVAVSGGNVAVTSRGMWVRDNNSFIYIDIQNTNGELVNLFRYDFTYDTPRKLIVEKRAHTATWNETENKWIANNVESVYFTDDKVSKQFSKKEVWNLTFTPNELEIFAVDVNNMSIKGLSEYIQYLTDNGIKSEKYLIQLYRKIFMPLTVFAVLILAASTVFGPLRSSSIGARVVVGIVFGFSFYATNEIISPFSIYYGLPPIFGSLAPTILVLGVGVYILGRRK